MNQIEHISNLVNSQFPQFYNQKGEEFIAFVEAYYEWMESEDNIIAESRRLYKTTDIDDTADKFLEHFRTKFMEGLPRELIGNQRLFQKHILELYRAKGSVAGLKLLFRLMYNQDAEIYVPSYDILKSSDGTWKQPRYIEVEGRQSLFEYENKVITGSSSGARALVESVQKIFTGSKYVNVLVISGQDGRFINGEGLLATGIEILDACRIVGNIERITIRSSTAGHSVGQIVVDPARTVDSQFRGVISKTYDSVGVIDFKIVDGGSYYTMNAAVSITAGSNTTGHSAAFTIFSLANVEPYLYNHDKLAGYGSVALNATSYGLPSMPSANSSTIIANMLDIETIEVGTIDRIQVQHPGTGYDGDVNVSIIDPFTSTAGIMTATGIGGTNAVITGKALTGNGLISEILVYDSGYGYNLENELLFVENQSNPSITAMVEVDLGGVGKGEGYFDNTDGFLSSDKYLYDGHYYQDHSYVIKSSKALELYADILKNTVHPVGNAVYGIAVIKQNIDTNVQQDSSRVFQS